MNAEQGPPQTARLAGFASRFDDPDSVRVKEAPAQEVQEGVLTVSYVEYPPIVDELVAVAYEDDWIRRDFDWSSWLGTPEAQSLANDAEAIERATIEQLARLLTAIVRQERFADGVILRALESGLLQRLVKRVHSLDGMPTSDLE